MAGMALAVVGNLVSRRALSLVMRRWIFNSVGDTTPFAPTWAPPKRP